MNLNISPPHIRNIQNPLLAIVLLCISIQTLMSQNTLNFVPLNSFDPNEAFNDLHSLDTDFSQAVVIGMGESTHGTHEFFLNRHRIFKYLVEKHGFNTFFLEADYGNCLRVNRYINGTEDSLLQVVRSIGMWTWNTKEMASLIEWMRNYNLLKKGKEKLQFIGCDLQRVNSTIDEIDRLIHKYENEKIVTNNINLSHSEFIDLTDPKILEKYKSLITGKKNKLQSIKFENNDKFIFETLIRHFDQAIEAKENPNFYNHRDLRMGENIIHHLNKNPKLKGFFWAHNGHIANVYLPHKKKSKSYYRAGGVLKHHLKEQYLSIGQDFSKGSFNAYYLNPMNKSANPDDISTHVKGTVDVELNENLMGYLFKDVQNSMLYVRSKDFQKHHEKKFYYNYIGAAYYPPKNKKRPSIMPMKKKYFDIVILIKESTPTKLLEQETKKEENKY